MPLNAVEVDIFPKRLRDSTTSIRFIRFGMNGFDAACRVSPPEQTRLIAFLRQHYRDEGAKGFRVIPEGSSMIRIRGGWFGHRGRRGMLAWPGFRGFRKLEQSGEFSWEPPVLTGSSFRITLEANARPLARFRRWLDGLGVRYEVHRIRPIERVPGTPLEALTTQQRRILAVAHSLGYYDIPRRASTRHIASRVGMNPGTVGRHLRRAEKHLVEQIVLWSPIAPPASAS